ncbi:MAG: hypothetical protein M3Q46_09500, partial [Verrucomicrobiota bacterium]|nr:hypothetical protein [Verrucomicrobiota bacterium]
MQSPVVVAVALFAVPIASLARIGDTSAQMSKRCGEPIAESFDQEGYGICTYRSPQFKEIRVVYAGGKSALEVYTPTDEIAKNGETKDAAFRALRQESGDEYSDITSKGDLQIGTGESGRELKFVRGDDAIRSYSGHVEIKRKDNQDYAVLRGSGAVVEIRLHSLGPDAAGFRRASEGIVTVLDHVPDDLWTPSAWVGKREHLDEEDMLEDAHNRFQTLLKVESGKKVIYDRSFCSVHQVSMELRTVEVAFGMLVFAPTERYCQDHFPHYRDFAIGGCVMDMNDEGKKTQ